MGKSQSEMKDAKVEDGEAPVPLGELGASHEVPANGEVGGEASRGEMDAVAEGAESVEVGQVFACLEGISAYS